MQIQTQYKFLSLLLSCINIKCLLCILGNLL